MRRMLVPLLLSLALALPASAQTLLPDTETLQKARVIDVVDERIEAVVGTALTATVQTLTAEVLDGPERGETVTFRNDFTQLTAGETFFLRHRTSAVDGTDAYSVADPYRLDVLLIVLAVFIGLIFAFGGMQGIRGLVALAGSLVLIVYALLPGIIAGYPPLPIALGVSSLIIIAGSYVTHGFNRTTTAAILGMIATVVLTGLAAWYVVGAAALSGYNSEDSTFLHFQFQGELDLVGILMSGIIIGLLGVLYDVAIGQAVAVEELMSAGAHLTKAEIYRKALRIGREHIGALVNTLAIAYVGAALPLLLLFYGAMDRAAYIINGEVFATEILRILLSGCGIILAVPITTALAVMLVGSGAPGAPRHGHSHR
ncbi:MAG TPA: YibE/F family protein [Candidatus Paceibacterota bacterium]|nr:YibE/F family protein [Candidatus Paceibacterota bacterium]